MTHVGQKRRLNVSGLLSGLFGFKQFLGTLFNNSSAGAILVHSRRPTDDFEAFVSSSYGRFNQVELEGAIGGPIIPDLLSGRIAGSWAIRDGITKNRCGGMRCNSRSARVMAT